MADEEIQEGTPESEAPKKSPLDNKMVILAIIILLQGGMAFAALQFVIKPATQAAQQLAAGETGEEGDGQRQRGQLVSMQEMVVSLSSPGRPRYLRTTIALEAADAKQVAAIEERMAEFRDVAIIRLSSHSPDDMTSFEGKEAVKAEIKDALRSVLDEGELLNVYFSDFVIQ